MRGPFLFTYPIFEGNIKAMKTFEQIKRGDKLFVRVPTGGGRTGLMLCTVRDLVSETREIGTPPRTVTRHLVMFDQLQGRYSAEFIAKMPENSSILEGTFDFSAMKSPSGLDVAVIEG